MMRSHISRIMRILGLTLTAALVVLSNLTIVSAKDTIKIGYAVSKTGRNAGGAATTTIPNYKLWVHQVNAAGGIKVGGKKLKIEVVEYDDRSSSEEAVRAIERLATQDKVDFILTPWGTGNNLAVGPTLHRYGYPQIAGTAVTDKAPFLAKRWPNSYWLLGTSGSYAEAIVDLLVSLRKEGKIGDNIAMTAVADGFGIDLAKAARAALKKNKFKLVYDKAYPLGTQDFSPIVKEIKNLKPDAFLAFSYPPGTLGITAQSRVLSFNPKLFYAGVAVAFPLYQKKFGNEVPEGVVSLGGIDASSKDIQEYFAAHKKLIGSDPDSWASAITYAGLQALQQAIEKAGTLDRKAVSKQLATSTFKTVLGEFSFSNPSHQVPGIWTVGQWQKGKFVGLEPSGKAGAAKLVFPKPAWPK